MREGVWVQSTCRVLRLAGAPATAAAAVMAAVLHVGHAAAASHRTAAALHGLPGFELRPVHVTRTRSFDWDPPDVALHAVPLPAHHVTVVDGIPATSVPRTLFDLAAIEHPRRVERAIDNALAMRLTTVARLREIVLAGRHRAGVVLMRELVEARTGEYVPPASDLEARFLELVRAAGLPEPERQVQVGGEQEAGRVDITWRRDHVVAELDSRRHHSALLDVQNDVRRDVAAAQGGWRVLRVTWADVFAYPDRTMARLAAALEDGLGGARPGRRAATRLLAG